MAYCVIVQRLAVLFDNLFGVSFSSFDILIYLLTAIGLTPGGSSTVHIYAQAVHRTLQLNRIHRMEHT
jgi:uncharacterized integral membrane protein